MSQKIYTKTGDKGSTSLLGGTKVLKSHTRIEAYGTVDELNSIIGLCRDLLKKKRIRKVLLEVQDRLFRMGASLATDPEKDIKMNIPLLLESDVEHLEKEIDRMNASLPEMKNFILPGGHVTVSCLHIARCVCRRAERCCVSLDSTHAPIDPLLIKYLNRLSDYLFVVGRFMAKDLKAKEIPWKPNSPNQ